jgi:predicted O-linked N-acetylglucosamine transferase (SPINDLY family)
VIKLEDFYEAEKLISDTLIIYPDDETTQLNLGNMYKELNRFDEALMCYEKSISINPSFVEAFNNKGNLLKEMNRFDEALMCYEKSISINPSFVEAFNNKGNLLKEMNRFDEALTCYEKAISIDANSFEAIYNKGNLLKETNHLDEALLSFERAFRINPNFDYLPGQIFHLKMHICDWSNFISDRNELINLINAGKKAAPCLAVLALIDDLPIHRKVAEIWVKDKNPPNYSLGPFRKITNRKKIKVGYFSADFREHAVSYLTAELFEKHNKDHFEIYAFYYGRNDGSSIQQRIISSFNKFINVSNRKNIEVAKLSREIGIDIAIDLTGITQSERVGVFAHRAAPIQAGYLGYLGTMGAEYYDYIFADTTIIPLESQLHYSEKIVYLPSYQVNDNKREIANVTFTKILLKLPATGFVFTCFNNNYKILPKTFDLWMRVILKVEGSVLWLLGDSPSAVRNLFNEAESRGVSRSRIVFAERAPHDIHLARHQLADLYLDTFPCNAHTSASDSLWAGLPLITRIGETFASRVAASLLSALDLQELIAETADDYFSLAIELASEASRLNAIKERLQINKQSSTLFNGKLFARNLEVGYRAMNRTYLTGRSPSHFDVLENGSVHYW